MKNINIPGVFPFVIALMLTFMAVRAHVMVKGNADKKSFKMSRGVCITGAVIFYLIAIFQLLEVFGISFR